jgi:hypothetical protein
MRSKDEWVRSSQLLYLSNLIQIIATERVADLQKRLETTKLTLKDIEAQSERKLARLQEELFKSQQFFEGLIAKDMAEIQEIENELKAEAQSISHLNPSTVPTDARKTKKDRDNWKEWPQAVLIRRWESGEFGYEHFKDANNTKLLRQAYKECVPGKLSRDRSPGLCAFPLKVELDGKNSRAFFNVRLHLETLTFRCLTHA